MSLYLFFFFTLANLKHLDWQSTKENGAAELQPDLCPLGKYGYDSRCRGWYQQGKEKAMADTNETIHLHITSPYVFATGKLIGQSVTSPLIDPQTQRHVGQTLVDFLPNSIFTSLNRDNIKLSDGSFAIVVTPQTDSKGHDTVYGPGFSLSGEGEAIQDVLQADDSFDTILKQMKDGQRGKGKFTRSNGQEDEVFLSFAPVYVKNYYPVDGSDITRGVQSEEILVYSLALAETADGLISSFNNIDAFSSRTVDICIGVLSAIIIISTVLIVWIAFRVTSSMTKPILQLLGVMKSINR